MAPRMLACAWCLKLRWLLRTPQEKARRQLMQLRRKMGDHDEAALPLPGDAEGSLPDARGPGWTQADARPVPG